MQQAVPVGVGGMAAFVGDAVDQVASLCAAASSLGEQVEVANDNSPNQIVVSGHLAAVDRFCTLVKEQRLGRAIKLPVSAPFHSSLMMPAAQRMATELQQVTFGQGSGVIYANIDAQPYAAQKYQADFLVRQICEPVRWTGTLLNAATHLRSSGSKLRFVEVGPGSVLQGLVCKTFGDAATDTTQAPPFTVFGSDSLGAFDALLAELGS
jgi:[acyl-carrier-protein] S-malonyltransferase